jgi:hypothetical protein
MHTSSVSGTHIPLDKVSALFRHRVARAEELVELGISGSSVYRRCTPEGPWQRILPGVVLLGSSPPTSTQIVEAALRYAEPDGLLTGQHALVLHGMRIPPPPPHSQVHVLVSDRRSLQGSNKVVVQHTTRMPKAMMRSGFLVVPLERALVDTVRGLGDAEQIRALLGEAVWKHGLAPKLIKAELDAGNGRGSALPRRVLAEVVAGIRTEAEALAATLIAIARLPRPKWNMQLDGPDDGSLGRVNAWWDDVALALDIDVSEYPFARTVDRHGELTAAGVVVVHTTPHDLKHSAKAFVRKLKQAYQWAADRDRPPVTANAQHPRSCGAR